MLVDATRDDVTVASARRPSHQLVQLTGPRYCRTVAAPPAISTSLLLPAASRACSSAEPDAVVDECEGRPTLHRQRCPRMTSEHENGRVVRRLAPYHPVQSWSQRGAARGTTP